MDSKSHGNKNSNRSRSPKRKKRRKPSNGDEALSVSHNAPEVYTKKAMILITDRYPDLSRKDQTWIGDAVHEAILTYLIRLVEPGAGFDAISLKHSIKSLEDEIAAFRDVLLTRDIHAVLLACELAPENDNRGHIDIVNLIDDLKRLSKGAAQAHENFGELPGRTPNLSLEGFVFEFVETAEQITGQEALVKCPSSDKLRQGLALA